MRQRILIVDDEPSIRLLFCDVLTEEGYEVSEAPSSAAALELLRREPFDAVILDIELQAENGLNLLEQLVVDCPQLPVILCTAHDSYADDDTTWLAESFVVKSCDPSQLLQEIGRVLAGRKLVAAG
ncbi:MAG: response regulator [Acidobacteria bacterium]|nr:response regulator [Acidobacteriota bacterium]